jgi:hypothetical protein
VEKVPWEKIYGKEGGYVCVREKRFQKFEYNISCT